jgi:TPR repeat protein
MKDILRSWFDTAECKRLFEQKAVKYVHAVASALFAFGVCAASAAEPDNAEALTAEGVKYECGCDGVTKDYHKAAELYTKAADLGDPKAKVYLSGLYGRGLGVKKDEGHAIRLLQSAADQGYARAFGALGYHYDHGVGVPQDYRKAIELYQKAIDQSDSCAMVNLGLMYQQGRGVPQNYRKAAELYEKAGDFAQAEANLANLYQRGFGVPKDYAKAVELAEKSAKHGNSYGENNLAWAYYNGWGVQKDYVRAAELFKKAAEKGNNSATANLGRMYARGEGVEKDPVKAVELYSKAELQGAPAGTITVQEAVQKNLLLAAPKPDYPVEARSRRITGNGVFDLIFDFESGNLREVRVVKNIDDHTLSGYAIGSLKLWKAKPRSIHVLRVPLSFNMRGA